MQNNAHLVDLEKCTMSIYSLLAKIGVDTAENEPDEVPIIFVLLMMSPGVPRVVVGAAVVAAEHVHVVPHGVPGLGALVQVGSHRQILSKCRQDVARFRLYRHRSLEVNTRFSACF